MSAKVLLVCSLALVAVSTCRLSAYSQDTIIIDSLNVDSRICAVGVDDFNGDGYLDIAQKREDSVIAILFNNRDRTFSRAIVGDIPPKFASSNGQLYDNDIATGDLNGDQLADMLVTNQDDTVYMFFNNGDGTFAKSFMVLDNYYRTLAIDCADIDFDGHLDFAVTRRDVEPGIVEIYLNDGAGNFSYVSTFNTGSIPGAWELGTVTLGDFSGDGKIDIVTGQDEDLDGGAAFLLVGNGTGQFSYVGECYDVNPLQETGWDIRGYGQGDAFDYDDDGYLDVLTSSSAQGNSSIVYFRGNATGLGLRSDTLMLTSDLYKGGLTSSPPLDYDGPELLGVIGGTLNDWMYVLYFSPMQQHVYLDIKPGSCPNPLNVRARGNGGPVKGPGPDQRNGYEQGPVLPVAILGTADFDVATIDPATVALEGVEVLRWATEDVATPVAGQAEDCACTSDGPDGYIDLTLKFLRDAIIETLGGVTDGEVVPLTIAGELYDGTPFEGVDCVVINPPKTHPAPVVKETESTGFVLGGNYPNPFNPSTEIAFNLPEASHVRLQVFNLTGRLVATLRDGRLEAGEHVVRFEAGHLASGMYLYRLQAGDNVETRKMVLLK